MSTARARLNIVVDPDLRREIASLARRRRTTVAKLSAELLREALDRQEDRLLSELAAHPPCQSAQSIDTHSRSG